MSSLNSFFLLVCAPSLGISKHIVSPDPPVFFLNPVKFYIHPSSHFIFIWCHVFFSKDCTLTPFPPLPYCLSSLSPCPVKSGLYFAFSVGQDTPDLLCIIVSLTCWHRNSDLDVFIESNSIIL